MRGGKLCTNMRAEDVTDTIELALQASGCDQAVVRHKPRLLSGNGSCYISGDLATWLTRSENGPRSRGAIPPTNPGQNRTLAPDHEEPCFAGELLPAR